MPANGTLPSRCPNCGKTHTNPTYYCCVYCEAEAACSALDDTEILPVAPPTVRRVKARRPSKA